MKYYQIFIILVFNALLGYAQSDSENIQKYSHLFDITAFVGWDFLDVNETDIHYRPNNPVKMGLNLSINNSFFSFGGSFNITDRANKDLPKTTSFDFQVHSYSKKIMVDLYLQNYKGFYSGDLPDIISYPNMNVMKTGAEIAYIINNDRFSARAAFAQTEQQLNSAGSFIVGGGVYLIQLKRDLTKFDYIQFGANFGYAHYFVITKNIFASAAMTGGFYYSNQIGSDLIKDASASFNGVARGSFGYNTNKWCASLHAMYNFHYFNPELRINTGSFQMAFTYRFDKIKRKDT